MRPYVPEMLSRDERERLGRNRDLKGRHAGRPAFVIGNGPSLANVDLAPLKDQITFVSNAFWKHPIVDHWQPTYYGIVDPMLLDGSDAMRLFFEEMRRRILSSSFLVPLYVHEHLPTLSLIEQASWLPTAQTYFVAMGGSLADEEPHEVDATLLLPAVLNVAQFSIMMALFMGCKPIYLLGLDHDWLAKPGPDQHFYEGTAGLELHPTILQTEASETYWVEINRCAHLWKGYEHLAALAGRMRVPIINVTAGSFLDVFPRAELADVLTLVSSQRR